MEAEKVPNGQNNEGKSGESDEKKTVTEKPRLKSRFRPNLGGENCDKPRRLRKTSNCESGSGIGKIEF